MVIWKKRDPVLDSRTVYAYEGGSAAVPIEPIKINVRAPLDVS